MPERLPQPILAFLLNVSPAEGRGEVALWRSVLLRATADAVGQISPTGTGNGSETTRAAIIAEAREFFQRSGEWFEAVCEFAEIDGLGLRDLVLAEVRRQERENGVVEMPPPSLFAVPQKALTDMPGASFEAVRAPRKSFTVERVRRRISCQDRERLSVIHAYLRRSEAHVP